MSDNAAKVLLVVGFTLFILGISWFFSHWLSGGFEEPRSVKRAKREYKKRIGERSAELIMRGMDPYSAERQACRELSDAADRTNQTFKLEGIE